MDAADRAAGEDAAQLVVPAIAKVPRLRLPARLAWLVADLGAVLACAVLAVRVL